MLSLSRRAERLGFLKVLEAATRAECGKFAEHLPVFKSLDEDLSELSEKFLSTAETCCRVVDSIEQV